ncbi:MAG: hypothetical protein CVU55_11685 [Deltaproteobacteria bacterium HGW-Deltaproteobacteria-13]|jgi:hypothetical protein|nr:MAG: hypothetical protein CVU55_11685 [Deltaproteobacteria bacterium HGW-Deltaproteobacteria-13]
MNIKGSSYVTTKAIINEAFGEKGWNSFNDKLVAKDPFFSNMIMSITLIPVEKIIIFFDELCKEFFNNDKTQYSMFGKAGAKSTLSPGGPYSSYLLTKDIKQFVELSMPKIWSTYFDGGTFTSKFENNVAHLKVTGIDVKHIYFENLVMGFNQQALKVFGKKNVVKRIRSVASGDDDLYFQLELKDS